jgi:hypothetical protein
MGATRHELPQWESLELLRRETIGRLCVLEHGYPLAYPMNYRVVGDGDAVSVVFRANPRTAVASCEGAASIEVDHLDPVQRSAWSVMARGTLHRAVGTHELPDTDPLVTDGRFQWLVLDVEAISGRRFTGVPVADGFVVEWQRSDSMISSR